MPDLLKTVEDGVMKLTFNRSDAMNALSRDMMGACGHGTKRGDTHCPLRGVCKPKTR